MDEEPEKRKYVCDLCKAAFRAGSALKTHLKFSHKLRSEIKCDECGQRFIRVMDLKTHRRTHNSELYKSECQLCLLKFQRVDSLISHMCAEHGDQIETEDLEFETQADFTQWKQSIEAETTSAFVKFTGTRTTKSAIATLYVCHRSGKYEPKGKNKREIKGSGSNKINAICPARMIVKMNHSGNDVKVKFIKTHLGHNMEVGRLNLSKEEREYIVAKIAARIPFDEILDGVRDTLSPNGKLRRLHLLTKKDLYNLTKLYKLDKSDIKYKIESLSLTDWVEEMKNTGVVRMYKPQGYLAEEYPELIEDDLMLIIANETQLTFLSQYGESCVCIDGTHTISAASFNLYTIMVVDENLQGFPCAFMFCNRGNTDTLTVFFKVLKDLIPISITPHYFMSDLSDSFFNAWCAAFGTPQATRLYCSWHVDLDWKRALTRISSKETQTEVYRQLRALMEETDEAVFPELCSNFLGSLLANEETYEFGKYFETFAAEPAAWAFCCRTREGIRTSIAFESIHRILKHISRQRLDKAVQGIMRYIKEKVFNRSIQLHEANLTHKISDIRSRHKSSLQMDPSHVTMTETGSWHISLGGRGEAYEVSTFMTDCNCEIKCRDCDICVHYYRCTCIDSLVKWNMCKHMHLVRRVCQDADDPVCLGPPMMEVTILGEEEINETTYMADILEQSIDGKEDIRNRLSEKTAEIVKIINETDHVEDLLALEESLQAVLTEFGKRQTS